jgi:hypothetical protein
MSLSSSKQANLFIWNVHLRSLTSVDSGLADRVDSPDLACLHLGVVIELPDSNSLCSPPPKGPTVPCWT